MKPVGKQTLLTVLVLVLAALNIGLVTFMWYSQRHENGPTGPATSRFLIKELNFSKEQEEKYLELQQQFNTQLEPVKRKERQEHDRFFEVMHANSPDSVAVASMIDSMGRNRGEIEYLTYVHFRQVRALCNMEQRQKFDRIIAETMRKMGPPPPRKGRPQGPPPHDGPGGPPEKEDDRPQQ